MKQELTRLLLEMFKSYGYETSEGTFCDIVGKRQDYEIWVKCDIDGNLNTLERFTQQANGKNSLYITTKKIKGGEETVRKYAEDTGVMIWDRDALARYVGAFMVANLSRETLESVVGNYCLESLLDQKKNFDPVSAFANSKNPAGSPLPEFYHEDEITQPAQPVESFDFGNIFESSDEQAEELTAALFGAKIPADAPFNNSRESEYIEAPRPLPQSYDIPEPEPERFHADKKETLGIRASAINMPIERAAAAGKSSFGEVKDVVLKFVPYWKYTYTLKVDRKVGNDQIKMAASGEGLVNAVNGIEDDIELGEIGTQTEIPDIEYVMKQPKMTKEEAQKIILEKLKRQHTQEVKSNDMDAQSIIYQNKTFRPQEKDFEIKVTQIFASVWEVQGKKDCLELNAYNGQPLSNPADDGAEFV
ncbi:hypothetical protein MmiAt1_16770 [Methanimicrococcus sp. At1]|uniref:Restriction endonuclease type IV Mrr domain-containing protein n=1 Tax=Methanimicrococcus hacksteinii TaxID=3028293 RepID=A0ABU3VRN9_9EURY|nr:hypothetical protein [Methanimicrococcus sp. At1]MDV0446067.1 hypothetical protein [Methanimicrococcus sp. At1]